MNIAICMDYGNTKITNIHPVDYVHRVFYKGERMMKTKTKLDRANYIMLGITNIVTVTVIFVLLTIAAYYWCVGMSDSNGGGWLLMMLFILGIACLPWLLSLAVQLAMFIVGFVQYRRNNVMRSRVFGLVSSVASFVANLISSITLLSAFSKEWSYFVVILSVGIVVVGYCLTTIIFSCINMSK